jgi:transcriptional regulator with XRE-family HTH domain
MVVVWPHGPVLLKRRKELGMTLKQVAARLGVGVSIVSKWERGMNVPRARNLVQIAALYGIDKRKFLVDAVPDGIEIRMNIPVEQLRALLSRPKEKMLVSVSVNDFFMGGR